MAKQARPQSNVDANLWAEALRIYTEDRGVVDRAQGQLRKHQLAYENRGVTASAIRARYKEADMTEEKRLAMYAEEQISRRALSLWDAESPEDFERLMERASQTEAATPEELGKLAGSRARVDGFNSGLKGGLAITDNPHVPGSFEHQQWAIGCADGLGEKEREDKPFRASNGADHDEPRDPAPKKARGRPRKAAAETIADDPAPTDAGLFSDMPTPPGLPH